MGPDGDGRRRARANVQSVGEESAMSRAAGHHRGAAETLAIELDKVVVEYESWTYEARRRKVERRRALDGVSIGFACGEIVGIEGPNGSGKSTLLRTICGIHVPVCGEVLVYGNKPDIFDSGFKRRIGYASSRRTALMLDLPLADSFALHCELYGVDKHEWWERVETLSSRLDLEALVSRPPREYSQGQRARAELGLVLLHKPDLVFLDEATEALDLEYLPRTLALFREMSAEGATIFIISHRRDDLECADRLVTVEAGKVVRDERI